ncbi:MAG: OsmC family protein [Acidimicrobiia bacterium]|nr:OsmC family protein [Acidimicrobiia bacterium]
MALAACMDGTIRMLADILEIELDRLRVEVVNRGDVRDILRAQDVRPPDDVGFRMTMEIEAPGAPPEAVEKLKKAAVASSAVLNMLRGGTPVDVTCMR